MEQMQELDLNTLEDVQGGVLPVLVVAALEGAAVGAVAGGVKWVIDKIFD
jgi:lactobin A/cerein 7B family class IIb bacteriocin